MTDRDPDGPRSTRGADDAPPTPRRGDDAAVLDLDLARRLPKVLLHEHLDGGPRPATVLELAAAVGHRLPADDPDDLADWFHANASGSDLAAYVATFEHTIAVMQTAEALERVAWEAVVDLAADGVVYAELRFAPELHQRAGLRDDDVVEAVTAGLARGVRDTGTDAFALLCAIRTSPPARSLATAELAARWLGRGVVGFDLAGVESGHPPGLHAEAFEMAAARGVPITIHAGEAAGIASIAAALDCGAARIGHGMRIVDDLTAVGALGPVAQRIRDTRVALEVCPSSNVDTGAVTSLADHPIDRLRRAGLPVTLNTDDRLMSAVTPSLELARCARLFGWGTGVAMTLAETALAAAFAEPAVTARVRSRLASGDAPGVARGQPRSDIGT